MLKPGLWWTFILSFTLMITGIQSLRWWTHLAPIAAQPAASESKEDPFKSPAAMRHSQCQAKHWRMLVLQR